MALGLVSTNLTYLSAPFWAEADQLVKSLKKVIIQYDSEVIHKTRKPQWVKHINLAEYKNKKKYQLATLDSIERRGKRLIGDPALIDAKLSVGQSVGCQSSTEYILEIVRRNYTN